MLSKQGSRKTHNPESLEGYSPKILDNFQKGSRLKGIEESLLLNSDANFSVLRPTIIGNSSC